MSLSHSLQNSRENFKESVAFTISESLAIYRILIHLK